MKNFGEKGEWAYPGTSQIFGVPPIISGTGKATDFKFGQYIQRFHPNKSPLKISEKMERGRIQGLPNFFRVPPIISGMGKAIQISNLASTFRGSIRIKAHETFGEKEAWAYPGIAQICWVPPIISGTVSYTHLTLPTKRIV